MKWTEQDIINLNGLMGAIDDLSDANWGRVKYGSVRYKLHDSASMRRFVQLGWFVKIETIMEAPNRMQNALCLYELTPLGENVRNWHDL